MLNRLRSFFTRTKISWFLLLGAVGIGTIWRIYLVDKFILWGEELWVYFFATQPKTYLEYLIFPVDDRPPAYYLIIKYLTTFSKEEIVLRLPSLISGIYLLISLTKFVWKKQRIWGVLVACLSANYYFFVVTAIQARDYGLMILVAWWQISMAWKMVEKLSQGLEVSDLKFGGWWQWSLISVLGVSLNYAYLPFLGSVWLSLVLYIYFFRFEVKNQPLIKSWLIRHFLAMIPVGLLTYYYLFVANQFSYLLSTTSYILKPGLIEVVNLLINLFGIGVTQKIISDPGIIYSQISALMFGFSLLLIGWVHAWRQAKWRHFLFLGVSMFVLNLGTILIATFVSNTSFFLTRFFVPISVMCFLLMTLSIYNLWLYVTSELKIYFIIFLAAMYSPIYLGQLNQRELIFGDQFEVRKENRKFIQVLEYFLTPGDQLLFSPKGMSVIYWSYFFENETFIGNRLLSVALRPVYINSCRLPKKLELKPGAKLFLAITGWESQSEVKSIKIFETDEIYPAPYLELTEVCETQPKLIVKMLNTAIWDCVLKSPLYIKNYTFYR